MILKRATVGAQIKYGADILRRERDYMSLSIVTIASKNIALERTHLDKLSGLEFPNDPSVLWVGTSELSDPVKWRPWYHGDKLSPTGMEGTVNVSDLLTQWKVPNGARESAYVLEDGDGDVLWVFISFENTMLSRVSKKVKVNLGGTIEVFKAG